MRISPVNSYYSVPNQHVKHVKTENQNPSFKAAKFSKTAKNVAGYIAAICGFMLLCFACVIDAILNPNKYDNDDLPGSNEGEDIQTMRDRMNG